MKTAIRRWLALLVCIALLGLPLTALARGVGGHSGGHGGGYSSHGFHSGHSSSSSVHVRGYTKRNGTYVTAHHRSAPDHSKANNWSAKGNVNPYTGKGGTKNP